MPFGHQNTRTNVANKNCLDCGCQLVSHSPVQQTVLHGQSFVAHHLYALETNFSSSRIRSEAHTRRSRVAVQHALRT
jgi:hypothetical protein